MAEKTLPGQQSLWDSLPPAEKKRIAAELKHKAETMPVKPAKKNGSAFSLVGYVRCELSSADKTAFKQWETVDNVNRALEALVKLADSGYVVKLGANEPGYQASLSAASTGMAWDGYVLTAHAGTASRAAALLVYKHEILMAGDWSPWIDAGGEDSFR